MSFKSKTVGIGSPVSKFFFSTSNVPVGIDGETRRDASSWTKTHHESYANGFIDLNDIFKEYIGKSLRPPACRILS